jgi:phage gp37-like protein
MSAILLDQVVAFVRDSFTRQEVATVDIYGGEFNSAEMDQLSYNCPAILITVLGWQPAGTGGRLTSRHARRVRLAAFVATKHAKRSARMAQAMSLAERLALLLRNWTPADHALMTLAGAEAEPAAENLYSRAIDKQGQALWLVSWEQCVAPKPHINPAELFDLLRVDITDHTLQGSVPAAPSPAAPDLVVAETVNFKPSP